MEIKPIAIFKSPFPKKFGIPKQSGLVEEIDGYIIFEPKFRNLDFFRGLEGFDYIWLIWEFSANRHCKVSPLVRPPILGGNVKMGLFATRSPFRPNRIGLSSVRLKKIEVDEKNGPIIHVSGADIMDDTPIYDIKPYIQYADSHNDIRSGFLDDNNIERLIIEIPERLKTKFSKRQLSALIKTLELDPRPQYHENPDKIYGIQFLEYDILFKVIDRNCIVIDIKNV